MKVESHYSSRMTLLKSLAISLLLGGAQARAEPAEFPGGFLLGSSLAEAQRHAESQGWELAPLSQELPGQWTVEGFSGAKLGLFVCEGTIVSIHKYKTGDLDDFATIVTQQQIARRDWKPEVQIVTFTSGVSQISNIDVEFAERKGHTLKVQLSSTAGALGISMNHFIGGECKEP